MAVNGISRWNLLRMVTVDRKSGTLVLQLGQHYVSWVIHEGNVGWISSTHPGYTMTQFLLQNHLVNAEALVRARCRISDSRSLGASLFKEGEADTGMLQGWTEQYAAWLCPLLLQSSTHMYWTDRLPPAKPEFVHVSGIPLSRILLSCERASVEVRSAFQFSTEFPERYRVQDPDSLFPCLSGMERRLIPYLKHSESLEAIYADPDLDRLTCCRTLLILWIAGRLHPVPTRAAAEPQRPESWLERVRSIPADWIIPLVLGLLLGVLLSPSPDPPPAPPPAPGPLHQLLPAPAWRSPDRDSR